MSYSVICLITLFTSACLSANENTTEVTSSKQAQSGEQVNQPMSMAFLLYLSELTVIQGEVVGPLDMLEKSDAIETARNDKNGLTTKAKKEEVK